MAFIGTQSRSKVLTLLQELRMHSLTEKLLVKKERARAIPVLIHKLQELSEDSGHMRGSGRDRRTVVSWQTMQTAQVTRERLKKEKKKNTTNHLSFLHNMGSKILDI